MQEIALRYLIKHLISKAKFSFLGHYFQTTLQVSWKRPTQIIIYSFHYFLTFSKTKRKTHVKAISPCFFWLKSIFFLLLTAVEIITMASVNSMECQVISLCIVTSRDINTVLPTTYNHCCFYYLQNVMCAYDISQNNTAKTRSLSQTA